MKKKNLIILLILITSLLLIISLGYYIYTCMDRVPSPIEIGDEIIDGEIIEDFILENEKNDNTLKTFIAYTDIDIIKNQENVEYYVLVLSDAYNIENKSLKLYNSTTKLYKFILKDTKIISSDKLNSEAINDYSIFPKNVIEKYLQIKDSAYVILKEAIEREIYYYNYYDGTSKQNQKNIYIQWI